MSPEKFAALTDRIKNERGLSLGAQAREIGISRQYMTDCRGGRETPKRTIIVALRAVAAGLPPMPEEGGASPGL